MHKTLTLIGLAAAVTAAVAADAPYDEKAELFL